MDRHTKVFLGVETVDISDQESFYNQIREKVAEYLDTNPELLMSYLYRLDIDEGKIQYALHFGQDICSDLARLIYERQLQRHKTKMSYRQPPIKGWEY